VSSDLHLYIGVWVCSQPQSAVLWVCAMHRSRWKQENTEFVSKKHHILIKHHLPTQSNIIFKMAYGDLNDLAYFIVKNGKIGRKCTENVTYVIHVAVASFLIDLWRHNIVALLPIAAMKFRGCEAKIWLFGKV